MSCTLKHSENLVSRKKCVSFFTCVPHLLFFAYTSRLTVLFSESLSMPVQSVRPVQRPDVLIGRHNQPGHIRRLNNHSIASLSPFRRLFRRLSSSSLIISREPRIKGKKERFDTGFRIPAFLISVVQRFFLQRPVLSSLSCSPRVAFDGSC